MSVYATDMTQGTVDFLYKVSGVGTAGLATLKPSDQLDIFGPLGVGFTVQDHTSHALILARGVGLATMGPLVGLLVSQGVAVTAICSFRNPAAEVGLEPFRQADARVISVYDSTVPGAADSSDPADVAALITSIHTDLPIDQIYTCGSKRLAVMLKQTMGEVPGQIALEQRMACGLGMCHACVVDVRVPGSGLDEFRNESRRVCSEGPVFNLAEVVS